MSNGKAIKFRDQNFYNNNPLASYYNLTIDTNDKVESLDKSIPQYNEYCKHISDYQAAINEYMRIKKYLNMATLELTEELKNTNKSMDRVGFFNEIQNYFDLNLYKAYSECYEKKEKLGIVREAYKKAEMQKIVSTSNGNETKSAEDLKEVLDKIYSTKQETKKSIAETNMLAEELQRRNLEAKKINEKEPVTNVESDLGKGGSVDPKFSDKCVRRNSMGSNPGEGTNRGRTNGA